MKKEEAQKQVVDALIAELTEDVAYKHRHVKTKRYTGEITIRTDCFLISLHDRKHKKDIAIIEYDRANNKYKKLKGDRVNSVLKEIGPYILLDQMDVLHVLSEK